MHDQNTALAPTRQFADFAANLTYGRLPPNVREALTIFMLDYLRVASLGQRMPWSAWATNLGRELGGNAQSTVMFSSDRTDPERATFINSTYAGSIDAILSVGVQFHFMRKALLELRKTGDYTGIKTKDYITARKQIEDLIGLEEYYKIEEETVEKMYKKENAKKKR